MTSSLTNNKIRRTQLGKIMWTNAKIERIALIILRDQGYKHSGKSRIDWEYPPNPQVARAYQTACSIWRAISEDSSDFCEDFNEDMGL